MFKIKLDEPGAASRYKARLVARGFLQRYEVNYKETFASQRTAQTIAVTLVHQLGQLDVTNAFCMAL